MLRDTNTVRFEQFHLANPHVFRELREMARALRAKGVTRGSIAQLFEVLRYDAQLKTGTDDLKLNNTFPAYYARLLMLVDEDLGSFFETRVQFKAAYVPDLVRLKIVALPAPPPLPGVFP